MRSKASSLRPTIRWTAADHQVSVNFVADGVDGDVLCDCCSNQQRSLLGECHLGVSEQIPPPMVPLEWVKSYGKNRLQTMVDSAQKVASTLSLDGQSPVSQFVAAGAEDAVASAVFAAAVVGCDC